MNKFVKENINNTKDYDSYVVFDDSKSIEYLDLNNDVIGWEKGHTTVKNAKKQNKNNKTKKITITNTIPK
jgi:hypothetical protein